MAFPTKGFRRLLIAGALGMGVALGVLGKTRFVPDAITISDEATHEVRVGDLVSTTVAQTTPHRERPALQEVLAATDKVTAFQLAGRFLVEAPEEDERALAEVWEFKVDDARAPRNVAVAEYVDVIADRDPQGALAIAQQMADAGQRARAVGNALSAWATMDVDRASEAIATMEVPESISDRVDKALQEARAWQVLSRR